MNSNHYFCGFVCAEDGMSSDIFGLYTSESFVVKDIVNWLLEYNNSYSFLPIDLAESDMNTLLNLSTDADLHKFLRQHSPIWQTYGGLPGWYIKISSVQVVK